MKGAVALRDEEPVASSHYVTKVESTVTPVSRPPATVAVVGLGYVGLPTALAFVSAGAPVIGIDISAGRIADIQRVDVDLLDSDRFRLSQAMSGARLHLTTDVTVLATVDVVIVCVPTPVDKHLVPDLAPLRAACATVVDHAQPGQCLVLTSTSYVGTTADLLARPLQRRGMKIGSDIHVVFSPERIDPGRENHQQESVPRVLGGVTDACARRGADVVSGIAPVVHVVSSPEAAEFTKLYENTFRAVNIAFANEMADIAGQFALNITEVIDAADSKPFGFMAFRPGPGVGGHCIPCDPHYLLWDLRARRAGAPMVEAAMSRIAARPGQIVDRAVAALAARGRSIVDARLAVVGVTYKPNVQDVRESPALEIIAALRALGADVSFVDPLVATLVSADGERVQKVERPADVAWDIAIVHTVHRESDVNWLDAVPVVLDATYRLAPAVNRIVP